MPLNVGERRDVFMVEGQEVHQLMNDERLIDGLIPKSRREMHCGFVLFMIRITFPEARLPIIITARVEFDAKLSDLALWGVAKSELNTDVFLNLLKSVGEGSASFFGSI